MLAMDRITDPDRYREARVHVHVQCHNDFKFDIAQHAMMPPGSTWSITSAHAHALVTDLDILGRELESSTIPRLIYNGWPAAASAARASGHCVHVDTWIDCKTVFLIESPFLQYTHVSFKFS